MTTEQLVEWLAQSQDSQRDRLTRIRDQYVAMIRELPDDRFQQVLRELKKRLSSKKLADEVATLIGDLVRDRPPPARPAATIDDLPVAGPFGGDQRRELEAAIAADPDGQAPYLPYADWLETRDDPFGPLVALDRELAKNPGHRAMKAARRAYFEQHGRALMGPLYERTDVLADVEWHMGFIRRCRVTSWRTPKGGGPPASFDVLRALLDEPGPGRFAQHLQLPYVPPDAPSVTGAIAARPRPALRTLVLEAHELPGLAAMWPALPNLRELTMPAELVTAAGFAGAATGMLRLEKLHVPTGEIGPETMQILTSMTWPALRELHLENHYFGEGTMPEAADLAPIFDGVHFPQLRRLALHGFVDGDDLCGALAASPLLPALAHLDLTRGTIGERGVRALLASPDRLRDLELVLDENYVPAALHEELARAARQVSLEGQRDDGGDPTRRYADEDD